MPMRTVNASNVLQNLHSEEGRYANKIIYQYNTTQSENQLDYSEQQLEYCVNQIKVKHRQFRRDLHSNDIAEHIVPNIGFTRFHSALVHKAAFAKAVIERLSKEEVEFLLKALVDYGQLCWEFQSGDNGYQEDHINSIKCIGYEAVEKWENTADKAKFHFFQLPLVLALCNSTKSLAAYLVERGADPCAKDSGGNTVVHCLVELSETQPNSAIKAYETLLDLLLNDAAKKTLLLQTNHKGDTALDMACENCLPEMIHALLNTTGVYRFPVQNCGMFSHILYDVTAYEKWEHTKRRMTPLQHLSLVTEHRLARMDAMKFLDTEPVRSWIKIKFRSNKWHVRIWMLLWIIFATLYFAAVVLNAEFHLPIPTAYVIVLMSFSIFFLLQEVCQLCSLAQYLQLVYHKRKAGEHPVAFTSGYRLCQTVFVILVNVSNFGFIFLHYDTSNLCENRDLIVGETILHTLCQFYGFLALLFFVQLSKTMGHYMTVIEKMLSKTLAFLLLSIFFLFAFSTAFFLNSFQIEPCPANNTSMNTTALSQPAGFVTTTEMFDTLLESLYETFLLILAVTVPSDWYFGQCISQTFCIIIYILCLIYCTLVLLNLLIAIMNERMVELCRHKTSINTIQQLAIYLFLEENVKILDKVKKLLIPTKWYKSANRHKYFHLSKDHSQVYLHTVEANKAKDLTTTDNMW